LFRVKNMGFWSSFGTGPRRTSRAMSTFNTPRGLSGGPPANRERQAKADAECDSASAQERCGRASRVRFAIHDSGVPSPAQSIISGPVRGITLTATYPMLVRCVNPLVLSHYCFASRGFIYCGRLKSHNYGWAGRRSTAHALLRHTHMVGNPGKARDEVAEKMATEQAAEAHLSRA
jgi:hypothetical protein